VQESLVFVVSPTEYGGQIEHAFDTAAALANEPTIEKSILLTRPGANAYLFHPNRAKLEVREILPPRRLRGGTVWNAVRPLFQVFDLIVEHWTIRRHVSKSASSNVLLVLDTSRYPLPRILSPKKAAARIVIFVHNARPHAAPEKRSLRGHVMMFLERHCIDGADLAVTHGDQQLKTVSSYTTTKLASVPLPKSSFLDQAMRPAQLAPDSAPPYALCIGELRENKGIEVAMSAAQKANVALLVAGKSEDQDLSHRLSGLARLHDRTSLVDEFLDKSRFDGLIFGAKVILLPYTHFDAQSGILAKAMKARKAIISSDLPALREQALGYERIVFVAAGETSELASSLFEAMNTEPEAPVLNREAEPEQEWKALAITLLANV
jgi:glycosyltransferase involved in cell wall biosynthesis